MKLVSMNINSIKDKTLELLAFLDFHQPHVVAVQETKVDSSIATSELFPEPCPYNVYRKDRNLQGGGVMSLAHLCPSQNWKTTRSLFGLMCLQTRASWYRQPDGTREDFQLFRDQLDHIRKQHKKDLKTLLDSYFRGFQFITSNISSFTVRLNKSGSALSQSEGQMPMATNNHKALKPVWNTTSMTVSDWVKPELGVTVPPLPPNSSGTI